MREGQIGKGEGEGGQLAGVWEGRWDALAVLNRRSNGSVLCLKQHRMQALAIMWCFGQKAQPSHAAPALCSDPCATQATQATQATHPRTRVCLHLLVLRRRLRLAQVPNDQLLVVTHRAKQVAVPRVPRHILHHPQVALEDVQRRQLLHSHSEGKQQAER